MGTGLDSRGRGERILVVEDESDLGALLEYVLGREGYRVVLARNGQEAREQIRGDGIDLVVLDLMLPDLEGLALLDEVRRRHGERTRVIILSARGEEDDRIRGLEAGADDYVVKPFSPRELVLRIQSLMQRDRVEPRGGDVDHLEAGPIALDLERHEARVDGRPVHLTLTEFKLLADLVRNRGRVRSRETLLEEVWGYDTEAMSRTIDTHVRRLRHKLGPASSWVGTVRGVGYRLRDPADEQG